MCRCYDSYWRLVRGIDVAAYWRRDIDFEFRSLLVAMIRDGMVIVVVVDHCHAIGVVQYFPYVLKMMQDPR